MIKTIFKLFIISLILLLFTQLTPTQEIEKPTNSEIKTENPYAVFAETNRPDSLKIDEKYLLSIDSIAEDCIEKKVFPGCQIVVLKSGVNIYNKCFGKLEYETNNEVKPTTIYDIASLTKTSATLLAVMKLYDNNKLDLNSPASEYLDFLKNTDKEKITIRQLLFHTSGLQPSISCYPLALEKKGTKHPLAVDIYSSKWQYKKGITSTSPSDSFSIQVADDFYLHNKFHAMAMNKLVQTKLGAKTYVYSCINFILLKEIIESISGLPMNEFLDKEFYEPMGLEYTSYLPLQKFEKENIAPTLRWDFLRTEKIQGYVHDPDAAFLGGVSGNAGLFSTARDIALIHQMLLNKGKLNGKRYLSDETCSIFTTSVSPSGRRGLGFDKPVPDEPKINPCCPSAPNTTYGHTGYTGTGAWVDPDNQIVYVFLSNRTYPNDGENKLAKMDIRPKIQEMIYKSLGISKNN